MTASLRIAPSTALVLVAAIVALAVVCYHDHEVPRAVASGVLAVVLAQLRSLATVVPKGPTS